MAQWYTSRNVTHPAVSLSSAAGSTRYSSMIPADEVRVCLLPEWFFPFAKKLVQEGRDRVRERVRIEPCRTQGVPRQPAIEGQLDVVLAPVQLGEHPADGPWQKSPLHFKDQRGGAPLGIVRLPA